MPRSESLNEFRLRKTLEILASKEGRGTELVTLYVPPGRQISEVMNMLRQEYGTASNIKSDVTRKNVQDAITRVMSRLKLFKKVPETGLAIFAGAIPQNGPGSERLETYVVIPPEPVDIYLYRCDSRFHIEPLMELLRVRESYGILVLDASSATYAILRGKRLKIMRKITSDVPSKHRAGGMSAQRFKRIREAKIIGFFRRIGKHAEEIFLSVPDLKGIIVAGPGPTKHDFLKGDYLHYELRDKVVAVLDVAYTEEQGVEEVVDKAPEIIRKVRYVEEKKLMQEFLYHISRDTGLATYGVNEVLKSLEMANVKKLLISEGVDLVRVFIKCSSCGYEEQRTLKSKELEDLEDELYGKPCPSCGSTALRIERVEDFIEHLANLGEQTGAEVEIISLETEEGQMLLKSFGGVAAILRYKLQ
ncbi:MAG TPA: peptide chain release factor 1 [Candidatus Bathyarchaeota archaeon]|nr:peptide chain release factor 1 [Candidatus Bathyarchaeota archaeon]